MNVEPLRMSSRLFQRLMSEVLRGKSLGRTLMNHAVAQFELSGRILDLGASSQTGSYNRFLRLRQPATITYSDFFSTAPGLVRINLEERFELEDASYDCVLCFNALEHVYSFRNVVAESHRILRRGGLFIGATPFLQRVHPDPHDYFRYSHEALLKLFGEAHFACEKMIYLGFGPFSAAVSQWVNLLPAPLRPLPIACHIALDLIVGRLSAHYRMRHPLGYLFAFRKT
jgi:SAM-dependent methyltransferase